MLDKSLGNDISQAQRELEIISSIFSGEPIDPMDEDGRENLMGIIDKKITPRDLFIVMPLGGSSASKLVYTLKGEFHNSERIYNITNGPLYHKLNSSPLFLQDFVRKLVLGLSSLSTRNIVHCDFKLENILCEFNKENNS